MLAIDHMEATFRRIVLHRMTPFSVLLLLVLLALAPEASAEEYTPAEPWEFSSQWGWYEGDRISYVDLGRSTNATAPAYRMVDAVGDPVEAQHLIFSDLRPGVLIGAEASSNYSDFHRIWEVRAPPGYVPNDITSYDGILEANLSMVLTDLVLNTPMVPPGSRIVGEVAASHPLVPGWWDGEVVHYFRFESSQDTPGLFDGTTGLVRDAGALAVFDPPGQLDILGTYPGLVTYSPLTRGFIFNPISTEFVADSVRAWDEAVALEFPIFPSGNMFNRPVLGGREQITRYDHGERSTFNLLEAWWDETSRVLYYDLGPVEFSWAPMYRFVTKEGAPIFAQNHLVEDVAPGILQGDVETEGYSAIWRYFDIIVEDEGAFRPNEIKSMDDVRAMGFPINETFMFKVAPMVTRDPLFLPAESNPPGEGLERVWYRGADVYLVLLGNESLLQWDPGQGGLSPPPTTDIVHIVDETGNAYSGQRPILLEIPSNETYSPIFRVVAAQGGDGYRAGRFRSTSQLEDRGWTLSPTFNHTLGGYVAGPINVPAWKPQRFTFSVGPVKEEDGGPIKGAQVRISRGVEVVQGTTDRDGMVSFEVNSTWNGKTVQVFISKEGYDTIHFPAEIQDYERFVPSGGYVQGLVSQDDGSGLASGSGLVLVGLFVLVIIVFLYLMRARATSGPSITEEEADEILGDADGDDMGSSQEGDHEETGETEAG